MLDTKEIEKILEGVIIKHTASGLSNEEVANELSISLDQIIKCLIVKDSKSNVYYSFIILASAKLDFKKVSKLVNRNKKYLRMAKREELQAFGYIPGCISPTIIQEDFISKGFVCPHVLQKKYVIGSAGKPCYGIRFSPKNLLKLGYVSAHLCKNE